jgi:hypothetical protein
MSLQTRQARLSKAKIGSVQVAIVSALFLVLFAGTLLVGGQAAIASLVQAAMQPKQDPRAAGAVVFTMPDGIFCRHVSFDNVTAKETEGPIERCRTDFEMARELAKPREAFSWHNN